MGMPLGMWILYRKSFKKNLILVLNVNKKDAKQITRKSKIKYKDIINKLPEFEKEDPFKMNIINTSLLAAFILNLKEKPNVDDLTKYYHESMMTKATIWFCKKGGKKKFNEETIKRQEYYASLNFGDRNEYSWNYEVIRYPDGWEARFFKCGICKLMKDLGIYELTPALCHLDYSMSEAGGASNFIRKYTLASGGEYCDCFYQKK